MRAGADLTRGRHRDLIGRVECEFRPVDPKWITQLMDWATWYYDGTDFPVLQAVYPDLENRFPEDREFDKGFEQPLMQPSSPDDQSRKRFLGLNRSRRAVFSTGNSQILRTRESISPRRFTTGLSQSHTSHTTPKMVRGSFSGNSMADGGGPVLSCFHHPVDSDPGLAELADLPLGWYAERSKLGEPWVRKKKKHGPDDESE